MSLKYAAYSATNEMSVAEIFILSPTPSNSCFALSWLLFPQGEKDVHGIQSGRARRAGVSLVWVSGL